MSYLNPIEDSWYAEYEVPMRPQVWKRAMLDGLIYYASREQIAALVEQVKRAVPNMHFRIKQYSSESKP